MNTIEKMEEDGYPIYGADFKLADGMRIGKLIVNGKEVNQIISNVLAIAAQLLKSVETT